jgi:hypothetical protein
VFTENETKETIFQMEHDKEPGLDSFLAEFYHVFWDVIKSDLLDTFHDFYEGNLSLFSLNTAGL